MMRQTGGGPGGAGPPPPRPAAPGARPARRAGALAPPPRHGHNDTAGIHPTLRRTSMRHWTRPLAVTAFAGLFAFAAARAADTPKEGDKAPDIDLPATQIDKVLPGAKTLKLSDLR